VAIGHGNGPQVGFLLRRSEIAAKYEGMHEVPLDSCGANSQGAIGYWLQQTLQNILYHRKINKNVTTVITQTLVDSADPAFKNPTKPIGRKPSTVAGNWAGTWSRTPAAAGVVWSPPRCPGKS